MGLTGDDVSDYEVTDSVLSNATGATHLYLRQTYLGLPVYNGQLQFNVNRDGRILSVNNAFLPDIASGAGGTQPSVSPADAAGNASEYLGLNASLEPLDAELMWLGVRRGQTRLVWNFQLDVSDDHYYDFTVDAQTGQVWTQIDWVADADTYKVYAQPLESPNHTSPPDPPLSADNRTVLSDPALGASPFGWHDTDGVAGPEFTTARGNNVHAYEDGFPGDSEPDCNDGLGNIDCDFSVDLTVEPSAYTDAAIVNLFYWNNVIHDIQYQYGFNEAAGNFQMNNYGNGGVGGDSVVAEGQDWAGNCNAWFGTPPDGSRPKMTVYTCNIATPSRDGDFDNAVIVHEYGHGISNRQVGGPSNVSCLGNQQQPGEGWSDWLGLAYTGEVGDAGADARGMGTYLFGEGATGDGIRPKPYSTDMTVNSYMYADISSLTAPHGVGFVWATITWEAYWELVNLHGFSADLPNAAGSAGNQRMMLYVNEGLKNTACSPTFLDARDGIIQAAVDNHGGEDVCRLWDAFALRGLGSDASTTGSNSSATNGFAVPAECGACVPAAEVCNDGIDNDCDNLADCDDTDDCNDSNLPDETACFDGIDNDCDGSADCVDSDCTGGPAETACHDGVDNDCNGAADCADSACKIGSETSSCTDGVDNDCDTFIDCNDLDCDLDLACQQNCNLAQQGDPCTGDLDCCSNKCRGGKNKTCKGDVTCTPSVPNETGDSCSGGADEDCDGLTDCDDPDCSGDPVCQTSCVPQPESCVRDSDCCSNNCSSGKKADRICLAP